MGLFSKIFGTKNEREIKKMATQIQAINNLENSIKKLSDQELLEKIQTYKSNITKEIINFEAKNTQAKKEQYNDIFAPILPEVFAITREASIRVLGMRHYDVQLIGGLALHQGKIAEMKTGEGKTLMATSALILNSLASKGVHLVTVNDYLASRDAEWMGRIYRFLGLKVGVILPNGSHKIKKEAYLADITYGQNNEFGFDYLRDNMKFDLQDYVQRDHFFAVVDEVDSILIDEARTPLIISGPSELSSETYKVTNQIVPRLIKDVDYSVDEKSKSSLLTESGIEKIEKSLSISNLYDPANIEYLHHMNQCLRAHSLFKRDVDYVIEKGEVVIVDEHTGRLMHGRRWSDGLHQAIEAKENVRIQEENQTLATITFQNYFRMYKKLSGMTGTADTESEEFSKIYDLDVLVIPTNKPVIRKDEQDLIFKTEQEKFEAVAHDLKESYERKQPVLVGTVSVEKSELLARWLKKLNIPFNVLNAKKHRDEAAIVAQAGRLGAITIATNMAGRGTDIILGGDAEFMARTNVAQKMQQTNEQIAQFGFLTGKPELINTTKLAERDQNDTAYYIELSESVENIIKEGKDPIVEGYPKSLEDARQFIFNNRKKFYDDAVSLYAQELPKALSICQAEKSEVFKAGGLRIIGTERHESRRIDNQLRGRSGRQGDPGSSLFYLSLQDDLMRIFGSDRMISMMERLGMKDGEPIVHPWVSKSIENAQKRVEGFHFDSRKQLIEYDDVMNQQRSTVYGLRKKVLSKVGIRELVFDLVEKAIINMTVVIAPDKSPSNEWNLEQLKKDIYNLFGVNIDFNENISSRDELMDYIFNKVSDYYQQKEQKIGSELTRKFEHFTYLKTIDKLWKEHLQAMDHLREGIHFRGYAQKDPKQEYKKEGLFLFQNMMSYIRDEALEQLFKLEIKPTAQEEIEHDLEMLEEKQKELALQQAKKQILNAQTTTSKPNTEENDGLNRHQRRAMKKITKKEQKK